MKKIIYLLVLMFCLLVNSASAKVFEITGDTLCAPLVVWNEILDEYSQPRQVATLPIYTKITIKTTYGSWHEISWYSKTAKCYKTAWVPNYSLAVAIPDTKEVVNAETLQEKIDEVMQEATRLFSELDESMNSARSFLNQGNYTFVTIKSTNALFAIFSLGKVSDMKEDVAQAYLTRGFAYALNKEYKAAIKDFDEAIYYNKNIELPVYLFKGLSWEELGFYSKAKQCFLIELERQKKVGNEKRMIEAKNAINRVTPLINKARN